MRSRMWTSVSGAKPACAGAAPLAAEDEILLLGSELNVILSWRPLLLLVVVAAAPPQVSATVFDAAAVITACTAVVTADAVVCPAFAEQPGETVESRQRQLPERRDGYRRCSRSARKTRGRHGLVGRAHHFDDIVTRIDAAEREHALLVRHHRVDNAAKARVAKTHDRIGQRAVRRADGVALNREESTPALCPLPAEASWQPRRRASARTATSP